MKTGYRNLKFVHGERLSNSYKVGKPNQMRSSLSMAPSSRKKKNTVTGNCKSHCLSSSCQSKLNLGDWNAGATWDNCH